MPPFFDHDVSRAAFTNSELTDPEVLRAAGKRSFNAIVRALWEVRGRDWKEISAAEVEVNSA